MTEPKSESAHKRERKAEQRAERFRSSSVGLTSLTQAVGECATELAAGSMRVAGGFLMDLISTVVEPCDRVTRSGRYEDERTRDAEAKRNPTYRASGSVSRAMDGVTETVIRSQERFREVLDESEEPDTKND